MDTYGSPALQLQSSGSPSPGARVSLRPQISSACFHMNQTPCWHWHTIPSLQGNSTILQIGTVRFCSMVQYYVYGTCAQVESVIKSGRDQPNTPVLYPTPVVINSYVVTHVLPILSVVGRSSEVDLSMYLSR